MAPQAAAAILSVADHRDISRSGRAFLSLASRDRASGSRSRRREFRYLSCALAEAGRLGCGLRGHVRREAGKGRDDDGRNLLAVFVRRRDGRSLLAWNVADHVEEAGAENAQLARVECENAVQGKPALLVVDADILGLGDRA